MFKLRQKVLGLGSRPVRSLTGLGLLLIALITVGQGCFGGEELTPPPAITLEVWRSEDTKGDFEAAIEAYQAVYPHVTINYRQINPDQYEQELFDAWARGEGPDIFSVPNWRVGRFREFISPMPANVTLRRAFTESSFGRKIVKVEENLVSFPSATQVRDRYPEAVYQDVVAADQIYGLPFSFDTLVMYYNRDLLARSQVAVPPTNWQEFANAVQAMVVLDEERNILQPAAAIGTADNISNFFDIVSLIMMQNGTEMVSANGTARFALEADDGGIPGLETLDFYTKFSDPNFKTFTWNDEQLSALETFTQGNLGFYFGYHRDKAVIEQRASTLNFSFAKMPQIDVANPVNYPSYQVEAVHVGSDNPDHAWNFINFLAGQEQAKLFTEATGKIPALKSLIGEKQEDPELGIFAQQALNARSWYHGVDPDAAMEAFREMVNEAVAKTTTLEEIALLAQSKVNISIRGNDE